LGHQGGNRLSTLPSPPGGARQKNEPRTGNKSHSIQQSDLSTGLGGNADRHARTVTLLDTNVIVYARRPNSPFHSWAVDQIANAVAADGAALSPVSLAELYAEPGIDPEALATAVMSFGVQLLDVPTAAARRCGEAYRAYCSARKAASGKDSPKTPLPDFFIGAHAELLDIELVTNDPDRFHIYFPNVRLSVPG
jgi:predicted nucleic acid-binding protein